jgi:hypothetical protein
MKNRLDIFFFPDKFEIYKKKSNLILIYEKNLKNIRYLLNNLEMERFYYFEMKYKQIFSKKIMNYFF